MFVWSVLFVLTLPAFSFGKVLKSQTTNPSEKTYTISEACKLYFGKDYPLSSKSDRKTLNCMGLRLEVLAFCLKAEPANPYLLRGIVEKDKVRCLSGRKLSLKISCPVGSKLCEDALKGCQSLRKRVAFELRVAKAQRSSDSLKCDFAPKKLPENSTP